MDFGQFSKIDDTGTSQSKQRNINKKQCEMVQAIVKDERGVGHHIPIHYFAPVNWDRPEREIDFDYRQEEEEESDLSLLQQKKTEAYCKRQIQKICYYL